MSTKKGVKRPKHHPVVRAHGDTWSVECPCGFKSAAYGSERSAQRAKTEHK